MQRPDDLPRAPAPSWVAGGPAIARPTRDAVLQWGVLALAVVLVLPGLFRSAGSTMEEGFMLVFPERLRSGDVPNVDFLHLYGPGSLHMLTGWFEVFGTTLTSQRIMGLLQLLAGAAAVVVITRPTGRFLAAVAGLCFLVLMITPTGLSALAWPGALALGLWSVAVGLRSRHVEGSARLRHQAAAGILAGLALSFRPDMIVALVLAWVVLFVLRVTVMPVVVGALAGLLPMWAHLVMAGVGPSWQGMFLDPVVELRPGRSLPVPPSWTFVDGALQALSEDPVYAPWWGLPSPSASQQLFLWFWFVVVTNIALPLVLFLAWRRRPDIRYLLEPLLVAAMFGLGLTGQAMQRPDSTHLAWGSAVTFAMLAPTIGVLLGEGIWRRVVVPLTTVSLVLLVVAPFFTLRPYLLTTRVSVGNKDGGYDVVRDDRRFIAPNTATQAASQAAVDDLARLSSPGERLLVGPADLSRTVYNDAVFYHLFPELDPATYFIEMDPGLADAPDSGLADDVASADWLILTNFWTGWFEPNTSSDFGSTAPNQVVADHFCLVGNYDDALVLLYRRCADGDGTDPSTIGIGPDRRADFERQRARREGTSAER
jgi:hypothetical protein